MKRQRQNDKYESRTGDSVFAVVVRCSLFVVSFIIYHLAFSIYHLSLPFAKANGLDMSAFSLYCDPSRENDFRQ